MQKRILFVCIWLLALSQSLQRLFLSFFLHLSSECLLFGGIFGWFQQWNDQGMHKSMFILCLLVQLLPELHWRIQNIWKHLLLNFPY